MLGEEPSLAVWAFCHLALYLLASSALLCVFEETSYFPETQPYFPPKSRAYHILPTFPLPLSITPMTQSPRIVEASRKCRETDPGSTTAQPLI